MPRCLNCGNTNRFVSSQIVSSRRHHEPHGLAGQFSDHGSIVHLENNNASLESFNEAWQTPEKYFDTCHNCGSQNLLW